MIDGTYIAPCIDISSSIYDGTSLINLFITYARYFLQIAYNLTQDDKVKELIAHINKSAWADNSIDIPLLHRSPGNGATVKLSPAVYLGDMYL